MPIRALSCDIGGIITHTAGLSVTTALTELSPPDVPDEAVEAAVCEHLHRSAEITQDAVEQVAAASCLSAQAVWQVMTDVAAATMEIDPQFRLLLESLLATEPDLRVVLTSNGTPAARANNARVREHLSGLLSGCYISCEIGMAKGHDWQLWAKIARDLAVEPQEIVHLGDKRRGDVDAPLQAGLRVLYLDPAHEDYRAPAGPDRYRGVSTLTEAFEEFARWVAESRLRDRPALAVRCSTLIRDYRDRTLITIAPDDPARGKLWTFPGGRLAARGRESPAHCARRETREELGVDLELSDDDLLYYGWSYAETSNGDNKIHWIFDGGRHNSDEIVLRLDPVEIREARWASTEELKELLDPSERQRLRDIEAGHRWGVQWNTFRMPRTG